MDAHDVGRSRGGSVAALRAIACPTLVLGIDSDVLYPLPEQQFLAQHIPKSSFHLIDSKHGHDGFLLEHDEVQHVIQSFLRRASK